MYATSTSATDIPIEAKVSFLRRPDAYPDPSETIDVVETHLSWVFLGTRVYKFKKPVRYAFLDFTTLELRRQNCEREVNLNRRLAPEVYLGVVPLTLESTGELKIDGKGNTVEWLVEMKRLPADRMLDASIRAGTVTQHDIQTLVRRLVSFYRNAERVATDAQAYRASFATGVTSNRAELLQPRYGLPSAPIERVTAAQLRFLERQGAALDERARDNRIVDAHGDLRPEHIFLNDEPKIIDCLEFKREFRLLDPVDELSFLAMECERLGAGGIGDRILGGYLAASGDAPPDRLVWFYKAYRACLRAKIAIWHIADHEIRDTEKWRKRASDYLALAERYATRW
jgi:aminoglycoside phosphotransferase family enzyme